MGYGQLMHPEKQHSPRLRSSLRVSGAQSTESKSFDFRLLFAPFPDWQTVRANVAGTMKQPSAALQCSETENPIAQTAGRNPHLVMLDLLNGNAARNLRGHPQHAAENIVRPEGNEGRGWR